MDKFKFTEAEREDFVGRVRQWERSSFFPMYENLIDRIESLISSRADGWVKVKAIKDESGHWYVIPNELLSDFIKDESNEDMVDSGEFDDKYGQYRTGGHLNLIQLYIPQPPKTAQ